MTTQPTARSRRTPPAPLRFTRRGRVVVVLLVAAVVLMAFSLGRASSDAATGAVAPRRYVVVQPGDTLWSVARRVAPGTDPRVTVARLTDLNDVSAADVRPGQRLAVPR